MGFLIVFIGSTLTIMMPIFLFVGIKDEDLSWKLVFFPFLVLLILILMMFGVYLVIEFWIFVVNALGIK